MLETITPLILTYNEAPNIDRTLQQLTWAQQIIVIDSYSTDETLEILSSYPKVEVFQHTFKSFANQCNFGLSKITSTWVLSLDADYVLSQKLIDEIKALPDNSEIDSYSIPFQYCIFGQPLRGTLLPPRKVLYRVAKATYEDDGHAHRVKILGTSQSLIHYIYHDDRKPLSRWLWAQDRYMIIEAKKLLDTPAHELSWGDRIRKKKVLAPFVILIYCLILKGGILDGWHGWYYAFQRVLAELVLSIRLIEAELQK
jgi:glycosyltransferase involved in cell wall biosynthesis